MFEKTTMTFSTASLKKYSSFIILFALLLSIGGILWFVIVPLKQTLLDRARGIQEFYAEEENQTKQVSRLPELKNQYTTITEKESALDILLTEDQIVEFVKTLEGLASETNVQMIITSKENGQIVEPKKVVAKVATPATKNDDTAGDVTSTKPKGVVNIEDDVPFNRYLHLSIKTEGKYKDTVEFLRKMETLPVGLDVVGIEMKRIDVSTDKNASGVSGNPFALLGSGSVTTETPAKDAIQDLLSSTFDVFVYVRK